MNKIIKMSKYL